MGASSRTRGRIACIAIATLVAVVSTACTGTWGIRSSYRTYITSPIAQGTITVADDVKWLDGPGTGRGPVQWPIESSSFNPTTRKGEIQFNGQVSTIGHETDAGYVLDNTFSRPRLVINGNTGSLYMDLEYRPFVSTNPETLPPLESATNVKFATLDLSTQSWTPDSQGWYQITNAPTIGVKAAMKRIGWDVFYGDPVTLDPLSVRFQAG
jgi:hypothetical protein